MSPESLLNRLVTLFPAFIGYWDDPANCFRDDEGKFTHCGAFAEFSHFFREQYEQLPTERVVALADLLTECMTTPHSEADVAAATCFLENVAGERFSKEFKGYLRGEPLRFFSQFDGIG
jgi:hypothetical protein